MRNHMSVLVKPASSLCNMRCGYCFYADVSNCRETGSYGLMTHETAKRLIETAAEAVGEGGSLSFAFQGGEPTLAGIGFYRDFFPMAQTLAQGVHVSFSFQTNGLLLDEAWCALFRKYGVLIGLSLDGPPAFHNANRLDAGGKGTYGRVRAAMACLERSGVEFNVLSVLTRRSARHPAAVWNWLEKEKVKYVQFIPCLDALDAQHCSPWALTPRLFWEFYRRLFPLWRRNLEGGRLISVKLFDDLLNQYLAGRPTACGIEGRCAVQNVVEANGDIFPCDFYALDRYRLGCVMDKNCFAPNPNGELFLAQGREYACGGLCQSCAYGETCGGGCKRLKDSVCFEDGVCYYAALLDEILQPLLAAGRSALQQLSAADLRRRVSR